jgi:hypothetical protein
MPPTRTPIELATIFGAFPPNQFREFVRVQDATQLLRWLQWADVQIFQMKLLETTNPEILREAKCLNMMEEEQRLFVVSRLSDHEQALALEHLDSWQEECRAEWGGGVIDLLVMTREQLPAHYSAEMKSCVGCRKGYEVWASVVTADCRIHSLCRSCSLPDGCCPQCNLEKPGLCH